MHRHAHASMVRVISPLRLEAQTGDSAAQTNDGLSSAAQPPFRQAQGLEPAEGQQSRPRQLPHKAQDAQKQSRGPDPPAPFEPLVAN